MFGLTLWGTASFLVGKVLAAGAEGTGHLASTVRKQRAVQLSSLSPLCAREAHAPGSALISLRVDLPISVTSSGYHNPSQAVPEAGLT